MWDYDHLSASAAVPTGIDACIGVSASPTRVAISAGLVPERMPLFSLLA